MTQHLRRPFGSLVQILALGLVVLGMAFLVACTGGEDATPTATVTSAEPTQEAPSPTPVPTSTEAATAPPPEEPLQVVATSNIVADWVEVVGGDRVDVFSLHEPGSDPHNLVPGAGDVAKVAAADIVFSVGLSLEAIWLEDLVHNASADPSRVVALGDGVDPLEFMELGGHGDDDHMDARMDEHADDHMDEHADDHGKEEIIGRLLVADGEAGKLSVVDLESGEVDSGIFEIAAPNANVYSSPTHRYGIVLARGPEDGDDRIHIFDGGVFLVPHGDHYDLVSEPVSRHALEIVDEWPVHYVNSHGWTTIFADTNGHVILINEHDLAGSQGDYEPIVLEAGPQHGAAFVISDDHVILSTNNPACTEFIPGSWECLPLGVEVRTFDNEVVYDAGSCPNLHGEGHNEHGAVFGCWDGVLFVHAHDGEYEHEIIPYPPEAGEEGEFAIGQYFGHHDSDHFFGQSTLFPDGQCCAQGGVWLVDVGRGEMREVFPEPSAAAAFSSDGETFYILAADGALRAYDAHDGELIGTMQLIDPFEMMFGSPSPAMMVVGEWLYVADPNSGHILGVHLEHMEIEEEWELGGAPSSLAFVGIAGEPEGHDDHGDEEEGHDDHMDEHGHEEDHDDHGDEEEGHDDHMDEHGHEEDHDDHGDEEEGHDDHMDEHGHAHGALDPHFWFDPNRVKIAVNNIAARLSALDPEGTDFYFQNAADYGMQLDELHSWTQEQVEQIPPERRLLVTSHDTFAYFADVYGFEVIGALIPSLAPDVEPSAEHLAELVEVIREHNAPAVFSETTVSGKLPQALARETGAVFAQLYADSLGEIGSPAGTYLGMVRANVERMVEALK